MDSAVEGDRGFLIEYMDVYSKLLSECMRQNVLLIGVSGGPRVDAYYRLIFSEKQSLSKFLRYFYKLLPLHAPIICL